MTDILNDMKQLGLNEYEIKAYISLLKDYPVNGYTLSKNSGVPRSRIYEVLENLKNKQIVFEKQDEKGNVYYPIDPELLIEKIRLSIEKSLENVSEYTKDIYKENKEDNFLRVIKGKSKILEFSRLVIKKSMKRIALFIWEEEMEYLKNDIQDALDRGVTLKGIYFGKGNPFDGRLVSHRRVERYLAEKKDRQIIIAVDMEEILSGGASRGEEDQATWTKDKGFVKMGEDYIEHDVMLNLYAYQLEKKERLEFERISDSIRKDYFGYTDDEFKNFEKLG